MFASLPLTALRTFESAARLRSFKAAAEELAVTPTAVSHQIKSLEGRLGVLLFSRRPRGVRLTAEGERLFRGLHEALLDIADASMRCVRNSALPGCWSRRPIPSRRSG